MKFVPHLTLVTLFSTSAAMAGGTHEGQKFAVGKPASSNPDRIVEVLMHDSMHFEFNPRLETLQSGEVVRFVLNNEGAITHEFSIGNSEEQKSHASMMRKMPEMKHNDPNSVSLEPGESTELTWRFKGEDTVVFACNIPGHFEAGMRNKVTIKDA